MQGERLGTVWALAATDPVDAVALLRYSCGRMAEQGCSRMLAPMDGSTWGPYPCRLEAPLGFHGQSRYLSSLCALGRCLLPKPRGSPEPSAAARPSVP